MDYEKKYNEALERARSLWREAIEKEYVDDYLKDYETIFPELRESEDERIRKSIVATIEQCPDDFLNPKNRDRMLAYLEKQKQMIEEAVEGEVIIYDGLWQIHAPDLDTVLRKMDEGDKVKIIIVKED